MNHLLNLHENSGRSTMVCDYQLIHFIATYFKLLSKKSGKSWFFFKFYSFYSWKNVLSFSVSRAPPEAYLGASRRSMMKLFIKIVDSWKFVIILAKSSWHGLDNVSERNPWHHTVLLEEGVVTCTQNSESHISHDIISSLFADRRERLFWAPVPFGYCAHPRKWWSVRDIISFEVPHSVTKIRIPNIRNWTYTVCSCWGVWRTSALRCIGLDHFSKFTYKSLLKAIDALG